MKLCQSIILLIIAMSILGAVKIPKASAANITLNRVISKWTVGAPWEPIEFGVNVSNSEIDVLNVTLFYSINTTIPIPSAIPNKSSFSKVAMQLAEGDLRSAFWNYTLPGQPNSTSVYYAYAVYYVDGSYDGPVPSLDQPYLWKVYSPERVFTLIYLGIANVDPTTLIVDIECSFNIVWDSSPDSLQIEVRNKNDGYYTDQQYVTIPSTSLRYRYSGSARIDNLHLVGDPSLFPFDNYTLQPEFRLFGADRSETTVQNIGVLESITNVWNLPHNEITAADDTIAAKFEFERRVQNALTVLIPLLTCCFLLGASLLLSSLKHLTVRLTIYIALLFFLFNFTSNVRAYVPVTASGTSFAEMAFLYMPLFVGIYLVLSILGGWVSDFLSQDSRKLIVATLLDSFAVLSAVIVSACWIVVQSLYTSKTLIGMMPDNLWKAEFLLGLSFGLIFNLGKAAWTFSRTHKKPHLPMFHRGKQSQRVPIALETA
jgi:hypothetical protein